MRNALILTLAIVVFGMWSPAAYAQEPRAYVEGARGLSAIMGAATTGNTTGEVGLRVAPRLVIFGSVGRIQNAQSSVLQTSLTDAVAALAADDLTATGTVKVPAWYSLGGARFQISNRTAIQPYLFGGMGFARLNPSARFLYESGTTLSGNLAAVGDNITSDVVANGLFTIPAATTGLMLRTGGGVQVPLGRHLIGDVNYSVSRISSDTPLHAQDLTFGLGLRF